MSCKKAVLISIRPEWVEKITSGKKKFEVRKNRPKLEFPFKCFIYETKGRTETPWIDEDGHTIFKGRGQVIGEFECDSIFPIQVECDCPAFLGAGIEIPGTCLTDRQILEYLGNGKQGYAWHISALKVYEKPRDISEFIPNCRFLEGGGECQYMKVDCNMQKRDYNPDGSVNVVLCKRKLQRPPQSWCYVEVNCNG